MNKTFYKNTLDNLREFNGSIPDWNESNNKAAEEWNKFAPKTREDYEEYYRSSKEYINAMASYNQTGKKLRLYSKIKKVIDDLGDVKSIVDFGCGVGSDSLEFASEGFDVTAMDLPSVALDFVKFRVKKYESDVKIIPIENGTEIPHCDLILSLDTLEHVFDPYATLQMMFDANPKYILLTTAFGIHHTAEHEIPHHTDHSVAKVEKFIEKNGYKKQKLSVAFPPRLFIKQ